MFAVPVRSAARANRAARHRRTRSRIGRQGFNALERGTGRTGAGAGRAGVRARRDQSSALQIFSRDRRGTVPYFSRRPRARRAQEAAGRAGRADAGAAQIQQERNPPAQHRRQPGRADPVSFQAARIARHQGKGAARIQAPDDRGQPPAQGLRKSRRQDAARRARQDSAPATGGTVGLAGIRAGQRARGRHVFEQRRSSSEVARSRRSRASASRRRSRVRWPSWRRCGFEWNR